MSTLALLRVEADAAAAVLGISGAGYRSIDRVRGCSSELGEAFWAQTHQMVHKWHQVHDGTLAHASFARSRRQIPREVEPLLEGRQTNEVPKPEGLCREILKVGQAPWTFVGHAEAVTYRQAA